MTRRGGELRALKGLGTDLGSSWILDLVVDEGQMSVQAIAWAFSRRISPATTKFVLVALCDYVNDECLAYPSIKTLSGKTSLDRKTVHQALTRLTEMGYIADTGERRGSTGRVTVYQIMVPKTDPFKQSQKRNNSENGTIPFFPSNSTENGTMNSTENGTQNRKGNSKGTSRGFTPPSVEEVRQYCQERGNGIDPQTFVDHYTAKGWLIGKAKMKDWKAAVRTWEGKRREKHSQEGEGVVF